MTELEQKIITHAQLHLYRLYVQDQKTLADIVRRQGEGQELTHDDRFFLEHLGKAFHLVPLTQQEAAAEYRNRMKRHPGPGPLKRTTRRSSRWSKF